MNDRIRIKDIAERAGVSVGTVDRVLHNRPNVSPPAKEKVEKALKEMNYQPNVYASALAYNRSYAFYLMLPKHSQEAYWDEVEQGAKKVMETRRDFHVEVRIVYYQRFNDASFKEVSEDCLNNAPDGVVIVPSNLDVTRTFTDVLHARKIPFVLLDSYMPDLNPLSFFGQDSFQSGYFAAKMLMLIARDEKQIVLMKRVQGEVSTSKQQANREVGFRHYMTDHFPHIKIIDLKMPVGLRRNERNVILEKFFSQYPDVHHCITLSSKAHIIGEFLLSTNRREVQIMGYDVVAKNAECLRKGSVSFLIAQHAYQQGYHSVDTLVKAIILKQKVDPVNYMPIELLTKENIVFYRRTQL